MVQKLHHMIFPSRLSLFVRSFESASHHILYHDMLCLKYEKMFAHLFCASNQIVFLSGRLVIANDMVHRLQGFVRLSVF